MDDLPAQTLTGKVAIVTGSARGLGATFAVDLATRGANVVITYTSPSSTTKAEALIKQIQSLPNSTSAIAVCADMSDPSTPAKIITETTTAFGPKIDILVNNAAVQITRPLTEITKEDFEKVFSVNILGVILLTQSILPHLRAPGRIINISSVGARAGFAALSLYTSSKAGLEALTRSWAAELGHDGTTVNAVAPGPVKSEMLESIPESIVKAQMEGTPVQKRVGEAEEVASVVGWLAGKESGWVSGQVINVSGGWSMY